ncbi:MAG: hypothetical protein DHS20C05_24800 [Hyphococcus sp.]|nr:MAG: hypothetical protein DHS20C05_24800 [Marinicaulis sp.]
MLLTLFLIYFLVPFGLAFVRPRWWWVGAWGVLGSGLLIWGVNESENDISSMIPASAFNMMIMLGLVSGLLVQACRLAFRNANQPLPKWPFMLTFAPIVLFPYGDELEAVLRLIEKIY